MNVNFFGHCVSGLDPQQASVKIPFFSEAVSAGFPSPAQDYVERSLDLNELCISHPAATFFVRAEGLSMVDAGIRPGDILIVNRALTAATGDVVVASLYGEFTVKELDLTGPAMLRPHNQEMKPILIPETADAEIIGVVTHVIHSFRKTP